MWGEGQDVKKEDIWKHGINSKNTFYIKNEST